MGTILVFFFFEGDVVEATVYYAAEFIPTEGPSLHFTHTAGAIQSYTHTEGPML